MKTFIFSLFLLLVSLSAFAQVAPCPDVDGDKFAVCSKSCFLAADMKGCGDCNDEPDAAGASIHPGAQEIWDDGLNNDCKFEPWETPAGDRASIGSVLVGRFSKGLGRSITPKSESELQLLKDIMICKAAGANCKVDYANGTIKPEDKYRWYTDSCGVKKIVKEDYTPNLQDLEKCRKAQSPVLSCGESRSSGKKVIHHHQAVSLPGQATHTQAPVKSVRSEIIDYSAPIAKAQATADSASVAVKAFDAALKGQDGRLTTLEQANLDNKRAIEEEETRAKAAETAIDNKAQGAVDSSTEAKRDAAEAKASVEELQKNGPIFGLTLGGAALFGDALYQHSKLTGKDYQTRGYASPGVAAGVYAGWQSESVVLKGFVNGLLLVDQGPFNWESSVGLQGGASVSPRALGGFGFSASYVQHDAGGSVLGANAVSRGGILGLVYSTETSGSSFKVGLDFEAGIGAQAEGSGKDSGYGVLGLLSIKGRIGFGPSK